MFEIKQKATLCALLLVLAPVVACAGASEKPAAEAPTSEVVAQVGEWSITLDELDEKARAANMKPYQELYNARQQVLNQLVDQQLIQSEAAARGIDEDELFRVEVTGNLQAVTDEEIQAFYDQNKARMGEQTLDQVRGQIQGFLTRQKALVAQQNFVKDLREKSGVTISLDPPRIEVVVAANELTRGPDTAKVTIVEYSDFQWPYCARVGPTLNQIFETFGDQVRLVYRDYPLPNHDRAQPASEAARCANVQGKFWEYHDKIFANQRQLDDATLKKHAEELGLDMEAFNSCLESGQFKAQVISDYQTGSQLGVTGTPAFFINGRFISGAQPFEAFEYIINEELAR